MSELEFELPSRLLFFLLLIPGFAFYFWVHRIRHRTLLYFVDLNKIKISGRGIASLLLMSSFVFAVLAFSRPILGFEEREIQEKGVDVAFLVDVSPSMDVADIAPTRLKRVKFKILDLLSRLKGDRASLIAFSGEAFTLVPLTRDQKAFRLFLDELDSRLIPNPGTNITQALEHAIQSFKNQKQSASRAILIFSDGEDSLGVEDSIFQELKKQNILVFGIGVGTSEGGPVPDPQGGFKFARDGHMAVSKIDEALLQKISSQTGGDYVRLSFDDSDLKVVFDKGIKSKLLSQEGTSRLERAPRYLIWPFLILSGCFLFGSWLWPVRMRSLLLCFGILFGLQNNAYAASVWDEFKISNSLTKENQQSVEQLERALLKNPDDPWLHYNLGLLKYESQNYSEAQKHFEKAIESPEATKRAMALNNLGNTQYRQNRLQEALKSYESALAIKPKNKKYAENAEFVREQIKKQEEQKQKSEEEKKKNDQKKQEQDQKEQDENKAQENEQNGKNSDNQNQEKDSESKQDQKNKDDQNSKEQDSQNQNEQDKDQNNESNREPQKPDAENESSKPQESDEQQNKENASSGSPSDSSSEGDSQQAVEWVESISDDPRKALDFLIRRKIQKPQNYDKDW